MLRVDHFPSIRHDEDKRHTFNWAAARNGGHNEVVAILPHLSVVGKLCFLPWSFLVGHSAHPGILQAFRAVAKGESLETGFGRALATIQGRVLALYRFAFGFPRSKNTSP